MTTITVRAAGDPAAVEAELRSLRAWLEDDRAVRRHVRSEVGSSLAPVPGHQGDGIDILSLVLSSGLSAASLAAAIASWRSTRTPSPTLVVQRPDGTRVEISGHSQEEAEKLMRSLLNGGEDTGGSAA
ncbi:effector-associated constant component EACC1 [Streptomyces sp. SP18CS02]|uniref:effector-associated constant component EACC1 n=1 Tax=Streptomyces sp. SP18CS02 TaxID=3002531 RepID=UPI002E7874BB|nr:hypothetical protein [Streptomyces sp. SP18CS02]MEE1756423.1 hypothetical protein [Streptomyces sp. SP18CS02]